jgi:hypothetical protein
MSRQPSAELVYGVYVGCEPNIDEKVLEKIGFVDGEGSICSLLGEYSGSYDLGLTETYGWEECGYIISASKGFSAFEDPSKIPDELPAIDSEDRKNLLAVAEELGLDPPSWWLVPFYG